jgi:EamA domain-containing membrane protein RarD
MKYVIAVVIASIAYGFLPIFVKNARVVGMSANSIVFYRFFFTAIACFFIILATKKSFKTTKKQMIEMSFYGIFGTGLTMLFVTMSLDYISTGLANMLHFGYPAVVMMTMIFIFKEKATPLSFMTHGLLQRSQRYEIMLPRCHLRENKKGQGKSNTSVWTQSQKKKVQQYHLMCFNWDVDRCYVSVNATF